MNSNYMDVLEDVKDKVKVNGEGKDGKVKEGKVAKAIESVTSKLPTDLYLWGSIAAMAGSLTLNLFRKKHTSLFIGQWAAPILIMGVYNKLVKLHGSER